jgi:fused signal recognition particle receptor
MSLMSNFSFLITFVLFLVMIGLIWYHFNERINDQNNKISQMVRVLTTMTAEVSLIRKKIGLPFPETIELNEQPVQTPTSNKIYVSDEEENTDSDSDSDSESDSDSDSDSDSESDTEVVTNKDEKVVELVEDIVVELVEDVIENVVQDVIEDVVEDVMEELVSQDISLVDIDLEEDNEEKEEKEDVKEDYKKMSLNKLKTIVLEKKLTSDVAKLKKNDLLSILGVDV